MIAVVDDDESVRTALGGLLRSAGMRVETFASAGAFLASPHLGRAACLILDIEMPEMNGFELHHLLQSGGHRLPTVMMTANKEGRLRAAGLRDEIIECLDKPCDDEKLFAALDGILGRRRRGGPRHAGT